jgi:protein-L-isoaspartate O-methyltransferase
MVEALDLRSGMRVLEIGAGTGYNAAILKRLVGTAGRVTSVDLDPQVARRARRALAQTGHRCRVVVGDGRRGWPLGSPFDRIVVTASSDSIPQAWWEQLVEGGLVELPLRLRKGAGVQAIVTLRREGVHLRSTSVTAGFFMPLRGPGRDDPPTSPASLRALSGADPPTVLASLEGEHLRSLSADAGRRALATLLGPGRRLRAIPAGTVVDLSMFLAWSEIPHLVWCHLDDRFGFGVIGDDGSSIASVTRRPGEHGWIEIRGSGEAQCLLLPHIERWEHLGCPTIDDLRVTVAFDAAPPVGSAAPSASVGRGITVTWTAVPPPAPPPVPTPGDQAAGPAPPSP